MKIAIAAALVALAVPALAQTTLSGEEIRALVSDKTVDGSMTDSGRYTEFYAASGEIRGKDYTGSWTVEGDSMCFTYEGVEPACWQVGFEGGEIQWIRDGQVLGTGAVAEGNTNNF